MRQMLRPQVGEIWQVDLGIAGKIRSARKGEPELLASQNIYINASVLGLSKKEPERPASVEIGCHGQSRRASRCVRSANQIDGKIEEISGFAEIGEFIDMPAENYKWTACAVGVN